jgi:uncharacterized membrane protein
VVSTDHLRRLPYLLTLLGCLGLAISLYLVTAHYGKKPIVCSGVGDCNYVNSSEYASIAGVPISLLGVGMYASLIAAALLWSRDWRDERRMIFYWGLALSGAGYAAYLTYVELHVLHAICVWCVGSATILATSLTLSTTALFVLPAACEVMPARSRATARRGGGARRRSAE